VTIEHTRIGKANQHAGQNTMADLLNIEFPPAELKKLKDSLGEEMKVKIAFGINNVVLVKANDGQRVHAKHSDGELRSYSIGCNSTMPGYDGLLKLPEFGLARSPKVEFRPGSVIVYFPDVEERRPPRRNNKRGSGVATKEVNHIKPEAGRHEVLFDNKVVYLNTQQHQSIKALLTAWDKL
jgi:hypothetical protein